MSYWYMSDGTCHLKPGVFVFPCGRIPLMAAVSPLISLRSGASTHVGLVRTLNEDSFATSDVFCIVADGMGGHESGEVASAVSVDAVGDVIGREPPAATELAPMIERVNQAVRDVAEASGRVGMGTTLVGVVVVQNGDEFSPVVFNVGDSRCYRLIDDQIEQITTDHSHVEELVRAGRITPAEAEDHPMRNVVTRALGPDSDVAADFFVLDSEPARLLLCSDGLSGQVSDARISSVLAEESDPSRAAVVLVEQALEGDAPDNITAVVVDVVVDDPGRNDDTVPTDVLELEGLDITADRSPIVQQVAQAWPAPTVDAPDHVGE